MKAISSNHTNIAMMLINYGSNVNSQSKLGHTALSICVRRNNITMINTLLGYGADVELLDDHDKCALDRSLICENHSFYMV
jgi:ankyrin repeat protein